MATCAFEIAAPVKKYVNFEDWLKDTWVVKPLGETGLVNGDLLALVTFSVLLAVLLYYGTRGLSAKAEAKPNGDQTP